MLFAFFNVAAYAQISASAFDVTGSDTKFIGIISSGTKVSYDLTPGEHTLMVVGESADFMKATVLAGKTYYALVTPRMGAMKARFSFDPVRQSQLAGKEFSKWDSSCDLVENTPESLAWAEKNAGSIGGKRARYWPAWSEKPQDQRDAQTLKEEDGR